MSKKGGKEMSKLRIIRKEKKINFVSGGSLVGVYGDYDIIRPQTKSAFIIADDALLEGM